MKTIIFQLNTEVRLANQILNLNFKRKFINQELSHTSDLKKEFLSKTVIVSLRKKNNHIFNYRTTLENLMKKSQFQTLQVYATR